MSIWNTSDYYEQVSDYNSIFTRKIYSSYDDEISTIKNAQTTIKERVGINQALEESYKFLVEERDSLYERINLADAVSNEFQSSLIKNFAEAMRWRMHDLAEEIARDIISSDIQMIYGLPTRSDKYKAQKIFILQLFDQVRKGISKAEIVSAEEMLPISMDIKFLISKYEGLPEIKMVEFFQNETGHKPAVCTQCGNITTLFFEKCLYCGKKIID